MMNSGGHNVAGLATCDEGLMPDMSLTRRWSVATAYTYTLGRFVSGRCRYWPTWRQLGVIGMYALSSRTDMYGEGIWQNARHLDGTGLPGAQISNFSAASGPNQLVLAVGMRHTF